jgi:hypothetical protein
MIDKISNGNFTCEALINKDIYVVVLDDNGTIRDTINEVISGELEWKPIIVEKREDVIKHCKDNKVVFYILDIDLGTGRPQEGIDTAEEIRQMDKNVFICIFSGVPNLDLYRKMAQKIGVNYFEEKGNVVREGALRIALEMLRFQKNLLNGILENCFSSDIEINQEIKVQMAKIFSKLQEVDRKLEHIRELEENYRSEITKYPLLLLKPIEDEDIRDYEPYKKNLEWQDKNQNKDENIRAYESYKKNLEWREKHQNKCVAFADGKWLEDFVTDNLKDLLDKLNSPDNKEKSIFYKKVPKNNIKFIQGSNDFIEEEEVYELPMSFYDFDPS